MQTRPSSNNQVVELANLRQTEEQAQANARSLAISQRADALAAGVDSASMTSIFTMFLTESMHRMLEESARFVLFPVVGGLNLIRAALAWRQASLQGWADGAVKRALLETAAALAIATAVVGSFVAAAVFGGIAPLIFVATIGVKALYHLCAGFYYLGKASLSTGEERKKFLGMARDNFIGAFALALATVAVGVVMIAAKPLLAPLGMLAGVIGTVFSFHKFFTTEVPAAPAPSTQNSLQQPLLPDAADRSATLSDSARVQSILAATSVASSNAAVVVPPARATATVVATAPASNSSSSQLDAPMVDASVRSVRNGGSYSPRFLGNSVAVPVSRGIHQASNSPTLARA